MKPSLNEKLNLAAILFGTSAPTAGVSPSGGASGVGASYIAGDGIDIDGRVISAEVTQAEFDGLKNDEIPVSWIEAL